jgi:hypothetical protein
MGDDRFQGMKDERMLNRADGFFITEKVNK